MKIIHTSDWHLGRSFGPVSLLSDQAAFVDWFVDLVTDESADLVVIAGDLYDRAVAPTEAIGLFRDAIKRLIGTGTVVAAITGNHDGADRVAPYSELLDLSQFYLRGGYDRVGSVITHDFADGPLDLVLLPYLDPRAAPDSYGEPADDDGIGAAGEALGTDAADKSASAVDGDQGASEAEDSNEADVDELIERRRSRTHASVLANAARLARSSGTSLRSIAVAHAFVASGQVSDSERQLVVGGTGEVDASIFEEFSYVALGHLHRPQRIGDDDRICYSGTPLAYSFSEAHPKSVTIVELDSDGGRHVRAEPVPVGHAVHTLQGTMAELLDPAAHPDAHDAFVRAIVTDRETVLDAKARLAAVYPLVTEIQLRPDGHLSTPTFASAAVDRLSPIDAVHEFWEAAEGTPPTEPVDALLIDATARAQEASQ